MDFKITDSPMKRGMIVVGALWAIFSILISQHVADEIFRRDTLTNITLTAIVLMSSPLFVPTASWIRNTGESRMTAFGLGSLIAFCFMIVAYAEAVDPSLFAILFAWWLVLAAPLQVNYGADQVGDVFAEPPPSIPATVDNEASMQLETVAPTPSVTEKSFVALSEPDSVSLGGAAHVAGPASNSKEMAKPTTASFLDRHALALGLVSALFFIFVGMALGLAFDASNGTLNTFGPPPGRTIGSLAGLTLWVFLWYGILRKGKRHLYRWRNFLCVSLAANWTGFVFALVTGPQAFFVGPLVMIIGVLAYVVPKPKELKQGKFSKADESQLEDL